MAHKKKHTTGPGYTHGVKNFNYDIPANLVVRKRETLQRLAESGSQGLIDAEAAQEALRAKNIASQEDTYKSGAAIFAPDAQMERIKAERERMLGGYDAAQGMLGQDHSQEMDRLAASGLAYNEMASASSIINKQRMDKSIEQLKLEYDFAREMLANRGGGGGGAGGDPPFDFFGEEEELTGDAADFNLMSTTGIAGQFNNDLTNMTPEEADARANQAAALLQKHGDTVLKHYKLINLADGFGQNPTITAGNAYFAFIDEGMDPMQASMLLGIVGYTTGNKYTPPGGAGHGGFWTRDSPIGRLPAIGGTTKGLYNRNAPPGFPGLGSATSTSWSTSGAAVPSPNPAPGNYSIYSSGWRQPPPPRGGPTRRGGSASSVAAAQAAGFKGWAGKDSGSVTRKAR